MWARFGGCEGIVGWCKFLWWIYKILIWVVGQLDGCVLNGIAWADGALWIILIWTLRSTLFWALCGKSLSVLHQIPTLYANRRLQFIPERILLRWKNAWHGKNIQLYRLYCYISPPGLWILWILGQLGGSDHLKYSWYIVNIGYSVFIRHLSSSKWSAIPLFLNPELTGLFWDWFWNWFIREAQLPMRVCWRHGDSQERIGRDFLSLEVYWWFSDFLSLSGLGWCLVRNWYCLLCRRVKWYF